MFRKSFKGYSKKLPEQKEGLFSNMVILPLVGQEKSFFKVCLVGILNLSLKVHERMQKNINQSNYPK